MDIAKILPLYIGQKVRVAPYGGQPERYVNGDMKGVDDVLAHVDCYDIHGKPWQSRYSTALENVTLVLRRLGSITKDEQRELCSIGWPNTLFGDCDYQLTMDNEHYLNYFGLMQGWPECWLWMLEKGFDLFGLIDSGQAIDAATLSPVKEKEG